MLHFRMHLLPNLNPSMRSNLPLLSLLILELRLDPRPPTPAKDKDTDERIQDSIWNEIVVRTAALTLISLLLLEILRNTTHDNRSSLDILETRNLPLIVGAVHKHPPDTEAIPPPNIVHINHNSHLLMVLRP